MASSSSVNSAALGGTIASGKSAGRGAAIAYTKSSARGATIVSLTALAARRKDSRRRATIYTHAGLSARGKEPRQYGTMSWRSRHGRAGDKSQQLQLARPFCFIKELNDKEDSDDEGYKSPPGSPPRRPLTMTWQ